MAWADNGRAEPTDPVMMDLFQGNPKVFQDSSATTDKHHFGYIHDEMILWGTDFPKAVPNLQKDKKKYKDKNDSKQIWQAEVAKATEEIANGELDREIPTQPFEVDEAARDRSIDYMASYAMYAFRFVKAHPNPNDQKQRVDGLTTEQKCRIEAQNLISKEMYRHPLSEVSWTLPDIEDKYACDQWETDYWNLPHFDDTDARRQWEADYPVWSMPDFEGAEQPGSTKLKEYRRWTESPAFAKEHERRVNIKMKELIAKGYDGASQDEPQVAAAETSNLNAILDEMVQMRAQIAAAQGVKAAARVASRKTSVVGIEAGKPVGNPSRPTVEEEPATIVTPSKQSAPPVTSSQGMKKLAGQETVELELSAGVDDEYDSDSDFEVIIDSNDPYWANSAAELQRLTSTATPPDVSESPIDVDLTDKDSKTASGLSTTFPLPTESMELTDGTPKSKEPQNVQSVEVNSVPTTVRQLLSTPTGVHSPQMADEETATVVTTSRQPKPAVISAKAAQKIAEFKAARTAQETKTAGNLKLATAPLQGLSPGSKRGRDHEDVERPVAKRPRAALGDLSATPIISHSTVADEGAKCFECSHPDNSVFPPSPIASSLGSNLTAATTHSPPTPSPLQTGGDPAGHPDCLFSSLK